MDKRRVVTDIMTIALVAAMVGVAELLGEKEIIFPEITALAIGAWIAPQQVWRTNRLRIVLMIAIFAVLGVCLVRYLPLTLYLQVIIAFAIVSVGFLLSGTTFAPVISAMVLPVLLGTTSWVYPLAATAMALIIVIGQWFLERLGLYPHGEFTPLPLPDQAKWWSLLKRIIIVAVIAALALGLDSRFCIAPPLLVAFTEFSSPQCPGRKHPLKAILLITGCALAGALCRLLFSVTWGLPLTIAAILATAIIIYAKRTLKMYLPPAGAIGILAMLIPPGELWWYPVEILVGCTLLLLAALLFFREPKNR